MAKRNETRKWKNLQLSNDEDDEHLVKTNEQNTLWFDQCDKHSLQKIVNNMTIIIIIAWINGNMDDNK